MYNLPRRAHPSEADISGPKTAKALLRDRIGHHAGASHAMGLIIEVAEGGDQT